MNDLLLPAIQKSAQDLDPYYNLVSLHLKGDVNTGRNYNAFSDASSNKFLLTTSGDVRGSSFSPYGTSWSNYFDGSGDYLSIPTNAALNLSSGDFTIEVWVNWTGSNAGGTILNKDGVSGSSYPSYLIGLNGLGYFRGVVGSGNGTGYIQTITSSVLAPINQWVHLAFVKNGTTLTLYQNGTNVGSATQTGTIVDGAKAVLIGYETGQVATVYWSGYVSNTRIVKGTAVYTANFTPPTSPLAATQSAGTNISAITGMQTSLLICQSNRFIDNSTNNFTITKNGDTRISSFSPFLETDTTSGSGYYDGTGDGLAISTAQANLGFGTGDFSTEFWAYRTNSNSFIVVFQLNTYNTGLYVRTESTTYNDSFYFVNNSYNWDPATNFPANTWTHICITRQSSTLRFFVNGKLIINATNTANMGAATADIGPAGYAGYLSDVRVVKGSVPVEYQTSVTTVGTQVFTPPTSLRTAVTNTQLLTLQERGAYNTIGFQDESEYQHIITRSGNVAQGTFSPFSNAGWSAFFDGSSGYLSVAGSANLNSTGDFTLEAWAYVTSASAYAGIVSMRQSSGQTPGAAINILNTGMFEFSVLPGGSYSATAVPLNQWFHVALVRSGSATNNCSCYLNGNRVGQFTSTAQTNGIPNVVVIGRYYADGTNQYWINGHISNVRYVVGTALYSGTSIPVPTSDLTAVAGTQLLACQSNRFIDRSTNNYTITRNGTANVVSFSPFKPLAYDPQVHGGSGYFDGTTDQLTIPNSTAFDLGAADFTIEAFVYLTGTSGSIINYSNGQTSNSNFAWEIYQNSATSIQATIIQGATNYIAVSTALVANAWNHVAGVRNGNSLTIYVNGVAGQTVSVAGVTVSSPSGSTVKVSGYNNSTGVITGYVGSVRLVRGTAVYTGNFVPPSGPLPILPNTSLLLNFTNAGVIDSTGKNVIETYGNAGVITTAIKKYGTGSMYFDGTGDYLFASPSQNFSFGTGDFTIEAWFYTAVGTNNAIFQISNTAGGFHTNYTNTIAIGLLSGKLNLFGVAGTGITSTGASYATSSWVHVALVRSSGITKLYLNGTLDTTVGTSGSITDTTNYTMQYIIVGGYFSTSYLWNGYIDDLRITRGLARYTANFTAPTKALPDRGTLSTLTTDLAAPSTVEALLVGGGGAGGSAEIGRAHV